MKRRYTLSACLVVVLLAGLVLTPAPAAAQARPPSQMTWAVHVSLAPQWFDPAEHTGIMKLKK